MSDTPATDPSDPTAGAAASHLARNLAALRHARSLTQDALAKAAAVPRSTIANLESGTGNPSLVVLVKVAGALGVPIDELLASPRAQVRHWPAADVAARSKGRGVRIRALVPEPMPDGMIEVMDFEPGAVTGGTPHLPGTHLTVGGDRHTLAEGDVLAFPGNQPHSYANGDAMAPARGVSVVVLAKAGG
jgi:XRE family transcriptional regulator, regulator of sulfur utilization